MTVNDEVAVLGRRIDPARDRVCVDGVPAALAPGLVHYLLNKPPGYVCTASDPQGRRRALDLVPPEPRVFTVGRLDADSEGLIILTNDGALAQVLTHPAFGVEKEYVVEVSGDPAPSALRRLREGVEIEDGITAPARASRIGSGRLRIVVHEGRNRQVRRMCEAVGHPVTRLVRTRIGPVADRSLRPGEWRELTVEEVRSLGAAASGSKGRAGIPTGKRPRPGGSVRTGTVRPA